MDEIRTTQPPRDAPVEASDRLYAQIHEKLQQVAQQRLQRHRRGEAFSITELVHEVYREVVDQDATDTGDRARFYALASRAMRLILVEYARDRIARSLGAEAADLTPEAIRAAAYERATDLLALHEALAVLSRQNERLGRMVEYRFFGGLSYEEIAAVAGCPVPAVKRDWNRARAWLYRIMHPVEA